MKADGYQHSIRQWGAWSIIIVLCLLLLQGCGRNYGAEVTENYQATEKQINSLAGILDQRRLSNALIIQAYATKLERLQPDLAEISRVLKKDATSRGTPYQNISNRLAKVNREPSNDAEFAAAIDELNNLWIASDPVIFNDALLDTVNTLADLSQGVLARVNIPPNKNREQITPGSQMVGNPNYGQWQSNSSGQSFWAWYGQYALLSSVMGFGRGPLYYNSWYGRSRYSYYHDYGRNSYGSQSDRSAWGKGKESLKKAGVKTPRTRQYGSSTGAKRQSSYAQNRGSRTKPSGFGSQAKRSSSYSSYKSSSRGTSSGSRSLRGGK